MCTLFFFFEFWDRLCSSMTKSQTRTVTHNCSMNNWVGRNDTALWSAKGIKVQWDPQCQTSTEVIGASSQLVFSVTFWTTADLALRIKNVCLQQIAQLLWAWLETRNVMISRSFASIVQRSNFCKNSNFRYLLLNYAWASMCSTRKWTSKATHPHSPEEGNSLHH